MYVSQMTFSSFKGKLRMFIIGIAVKNKIVFNKLQVCITHAMWENKKKEGRFSLLAYVCQVAWQR
jgi:hypothetical protein